MVAPAELAQLAQDWGFSDQAHLRRTLREFAGVAPQEYLRLAPRYRHHVLLATVPGQFFRYGPAQLRYRAA